VHERIATFEGLLQCREIANTGVAIGVQQIDAHDLVIRRKVGAEPPTDRAVRAGYRNAH